MCRRLDRRGRGSGGEAGAGEGGEDGERLALFRLHGPGLRQQAGAVAVGRHLQPPGHQRILLAGGGVGAGMLAKEQEAAAGNDDLSTRVTSALANCLITVSTRLSGEVAA